MPNKKLILIASPPACGKTTLAKKLAAALGDVVYIDKDALNPFGKQICRLCGKPYDPDSEFFVREIRELEYEVTMGMAYEALEFANDRNAKVIAITDSVHSPMNLYSSCNLLARSDMVSIVDSLVAPLSVINALVVALCLKRPQEVKQSLELLEDTWNNYQVYLNDEINFIGDEPMLNYSLKREG